MKAEIRRLLRLADAQLQISQVLEARILMTRQEISKLGDTRACTLAAIDRAGSAGLVVYAAAMRRLAELDAISAARRASLQELDRRLFATRSRQDILMRRARLLASEVERKSLENEAREGLFSAKGRGKPGVIE